MTAKSRTKTTVARQRRIQAQSERADRSHNQSKSKSKEAMQAGPKKHPKNPLPAQHLKKPGKESDVHPSPEFRAPNYEGSGKLQGMTALISGGDSGIGRSVAVLFAREGADVGIVYLSEDKDAKETCRHVEKEGQRCLLLRGDVRDAQFCKGAVAEMINSFGQLSILVNNAAFQSHTKSIEDISDEHFDETLRTNLYGYFNLARAAVPHLKQGDCIINTGSETGLFGNGDLLDYSMTKGGIHAFTQSLAKNLVSRGIRVNAVAPGPVWTPLNPADQSAKDIQKFGASSAMGRPAQPEEIAPAYVFLAAPSCASYISGAIIPVLGGPTG